MKWKRECAMTGELSEVKYMSQVTPVTHLQACDVKIRSLMSATPRKPY